MDTSIKPICTVLLISYNHEKYIRKAVESVLEQKTTYEFVIKAFDDCSSDGSLKILREYEKKYENFKVYPSDKNLGAQGNIWRAYRSVDTKYCTLLECDDYWCDKKKLQMQIKALEENEDCSFCGHNTILKTSNERAREYDEGSVFCTNKILKKKRIFEYEDFQFDNIGGYIPLMSSRLIRMSVVDLDKIKYKESFLFDHTQFYYLLLKGKYYYFDKVMSVYRRTGQGTASSKPPLEFLNTFIQNSLDFNKETNYAIADKIFIDCQLQINFRQYLHRKYQYDALKEYEKADYINLCSPVALGDTFIWAGLKNEIEKEYGCEVHFIIKPQYEVVMKMYGIRNYTIFKGFDLIEWDSVGRSCTPAKGELFFAHPCFYEEYWKLYRELQTKSTDVDFVSYFKKFIGIPKNAVFKFPVKCPTLSNEGKEKLKDYDFDKIVIFSVEANSMDVYDISFWEKKAKALKKEGYSVIINTLKNFECKNAKSIALSINDVVALSAICHAVYSVRSGFCDLIFPYVKELHIYYPTYADRAIFGIDNMYGYTSAKIIEKVKHLNNSENAMESYHESNKKPYLFGKIYVPEPFHKFYNKHPKLFWAKKTIKKITKWH